MILIKGKKENSINKYYSLLSTEGVGIENKLKLRKESFLIPSLLFFIYLVSINLILQKKKNEGMISLHTFIQNTNIRVTSLLGVASLDYTTA